MILFCFFLNFVFVLFKFCYNTTVSQKQFNPFFKQYKYLMPLEIAVFSGSKMYSCIQICIFFYISSIYRMNFTIQEFYFEILWIWTILFHILPSTEIFLLLESKILRNSLFAANLSNTNTLQNLPREPFRLNIIGPRGSYLIFPITPIY